MPRSRRGRRSAWLVAGVLVALLAPAAVAGQSPSASPVSLAPSASAAPSALPSPVPSVVPMAPPVVRLLAAGRKPRAVREYTFTAGETAVMVMQMKQGVSTVIGEGVATEFELPVVRYTLDLAITAVDETGVASLTMTVGSIEVLEDPMAEEPLDPALVAQLDTALQGLVGLRLTADVAPNGTTLAAAADVSQLDPALAQQATGLVDQANQLALPLPAEPIGAGARWVATSQLTANGITFKARTTANLKTIDGTVLTIAVKGRQTGVPGPVELAGLPPGTSAELVEMDGESSGRQTIDLAGLVPDSTSSGTVRAKLAATDGTSTQTTTSIVTSHLVVRPGD